MAPSWLRVFHWPANTSLPASHAVAWQFTGVLIPLVRGATGVGLRREWSDR